MTVEDKLRELDLFGVAILQHGSAPWMRDYVVVFADVFIMNRAFTYLQGT